MGPGIYRARWEGSKKPNKNNAGYKLEEIPFSWCQTYFLKIQTLKKTVKIQRVIKLETSVSQHGRVLDFKQSDQEMRLKS